MEVNGAIMGQFCKGVISSIGLAFLLMLNACGDLNLQFDPSLNVDDSVYETLIPPDYDQISSVEFSMPPEDWRHRENVGVINEQAIQDDIRQSKDLISSQPNKTKFSAWAVQPLLSMINTAYLTTTDPSYLDQFVEFFEYFISVRMDKQGRINYDGSVRPQWERQDEYNILNISPYKAYSGIDPEVLKKERGWHSLYFSDVNYSGLFIEQMLRFAQIVREYHLTEYWEIAEQIVNESMAVVQSHENEWVRISHDEGYYIFPKGCPFFVDGVEMPINEAAIFGTALVRLYLLTGDEKWLNRALSMWRHWRRSFALDKFGYITYPYVMGDWRNGWSEADSVSVNSPSAPATVTPETFHKAALTLQFIIFLERAVPGSLRDYLIEFKKLILASREIGGSPIAEYPAVLGFQWPLNTFHALPPFYNEGWIALMHNDELFQASVQRYLWQSPANLIYSKLMGTVQNDEQVSTKTTTIYPDLMDEESAECTILEGKSYSTQLQFFQVSPKHNTLYLYVDKSLAKRIRLDIDYKSGNFKAIMFVPSNRCIVLSWLPEDEFAYPLTQLENQVVLTQVTME